MHGFACMSVRVIYLNQGIHPSNVIYVRSELIYTEVHFQKEEEKRSKHEIM